MSDPPPQNSSRSRRPVRAWLLHGVRLGILGGILFAIATKPRTDRGAEIGDASERFAERELRFVQQVFPAADAFSGPEAEGEPTQILDVDGDSLGFVVQTLPRANDVIGFSGPTNLLLTFDLEEQLRAVDVLDSGDTVEHVDAIIEADWLAKRFVGKSWDELGSLTRPDAVSGATLTADAMWRGVRLRTSGALPESSKFAKTITVDKVRTWLPDAESVTPEDRRPPVRFDVTDASGESLGWLLRTSPAADALLGYQGPTEAYMVLDTEDTIVGLIVDDSFDNEPYVGYLREDEYGFLVLFEGMTLAELVGTSPEEMGIEGVSGATMTSVTVADGLFLAAREYLERAEETEADKEPMSVEEPRPIDWGMLVVIGVGVTVAFTRLRGLHWVRYGYLLALIAYLGIMRGDMLSLAMWAGWAEHGLPDLFASGLVALSAAALLLPASTKRNVYCSHLCPHGAVQQLVANRLPWKLRLGRRWRTVLSVVPAVLLAVVSLAAFDVVPVSLVSLEAFDAWHFGIAGAAAIAIAVLGLVASFFVPMAYCQFGCPTGALLGYARRHGRSDRWTGRDWLAVALLFAALGLRFF